MTRTLTTILLLFVALTLSPLPAHALLKKGETLPELSGRTIDGEPFSLSSLKGRPLLLKIGTTWCGTCDEQSKAIDELHDFLSENGILSVEVFVRESAARVQRYFAGKGYRQPDQILLDDGEIAAKLNVYVIPRVILVDKDYRVYRDGGNLSSSDLKKELEQMSATD